MWGSAGGQEFQKLRKAFHRVGISGEEFRALNSAAGMQEGLERDRQRVVAAFSMYKRELGNHEPFNDQSVQRLMAGLVKAESEGLCGRVDVNGQTVTALMCYLDTRGRAAREEFRANMHRLGQSVKHDPIAFNIDVEFQYQPVDSQRLLQWAARFGKQEEVVSALARLHFEEQASVTKRATITQAAKEAGLDTQALEHFLASEELVGEIWQSYGDTINKHGIHAIPLFIFNGRTTNGGPFRDGSNAAVSVQGSADVDTFVQAFEEILRRQESLEQSSKPFLRAGSKVQICDLQKSQDLNGLRGICEKWLDESGRWQVLVQGVSGSKLLKPANLDLLKTHVDDSD
eukprot:TRINITY_DN78434_c0_g1_i1.p1 TRINITY_DN78434_c0_g1~~TRINITY_DN78434_c0_g1_i1.p1  ORF type:complete len:344 (-),score=72.27 TRINITY_DN78434_c0_g1_i1:304-1335(-)